MNVSTGFHGNTSHNFQSPWMAKQKAVISDRESQTGRSRLLKYVPAVMVFMSFGGDDVFTNQQTSSIRVIIFMGFLPAEMMFIFVL